MLSFLKEFILQQINYHKYLKNNPSEIRKFNNTLRFCSFAVIAADMQVKIALFC